MASTKSNISSLLTEQVGKTVNMNTYLQYVHVFEQIICVKKIETFYGTLFQCLPISNKPDELGIFYFT
jgi:hypothetical protein